MAQQDVSEMVHHFYEARLTNDAEKVLSVCDPAIRMEMAGVFPNDTIRCALTWDEVRDYNQYLAKTWVWKSYKIHREMITKNHAAVHATISFVHKPTNHPVITEIAEFLTFDNGLLTDYMGFFDTHAINVLSTSDETVQKSA